jgi:hypothetical protein
MKYDKYIGLPYLTNGRTEAGVDCWGLVRLFYRDELNIDLPSYTEDYSGADDPAIMELMSEYKDANWKKQSVPETGDVCVFNIYGEPCHVGVYIGNSKFMHSREGRDVVIESLDSPKWSKRLEGCYKPDTSKQIQVVGAPHPLKTAVYQDWTVAGTTVRDFVNFTREKYKVSDRLSSRLIVVVDGIKIPVELWDTTVLQQGQTIAYRSVPEGKDSLRMVLTLAVVIAAAYFGGPLGVQLGMSETAAAATVAGYTEAGAVVATTAGRIVGTMAINMVGMALINAIFPIRPIGDPGTARALNMFTGASNQTNKFGAIPVVLGQLRVTGLMGAVPYVQTTPDSSMLSLLIIWGFGPLQIDEASICVGLTPLSQFYPSNYPASAPKWKTVIGIANDNESEIARIYPQNIEQVIKNVELKNNAVDGTNNWAEYRFTKKIESIEVGLSFPEGMRTVALTGSNAGKVSEATAGIEIQIAKYNPITNTLGAWSPPSPYSVGYWAGISGETVAFEQTLNAANSYLDVSGNTIDLFQYTIFTMQPGGGVGVYTGAATDNEFGEPSATLLAKYQNGSFTGLIAGDDTSYTRIPSIPNGDIKLYTVCTYQSNIRTYTSNSELPRVGLQYSSEIITELQDDGSGGTTAVNTGKIYVRITAGKIYTTTGSIPLPGITQTIFTSLDFTGVSHNASYSGTWPQLLKDYNIWVGTGLTMNVSKQVDFPYSGYYYFESCIDDNGGLYLDGSLIIQMPGWQDVVSGLVYVEAGNHTVQLTATNLGKAYGAACKITYTSNTGMNALNADTTGVNLYFGSGGFLTKRKDAFNFNYRVNALPHDNYAVRVRRTTDDTPELTPDYHRYFKSVLFDITGYSSQDDAGNLITPVINPPGCYLAKTAIRVQSTNKVNGNIDGINAVVQTRAPSWITETQTWNFSLLRATNNPASLFIYVLLHPANAYRLEDTIVDGIAPYADSLDLATLGSWYEFCNNPEIQLGRTDTGLRFTYNDIITGTKSVMEVLRDICAAGMASPAFVDGKWTVIIDRPRTYASQYFTTHNSYGFESTKLLPKIPDGFRISFPDESRAFQINEVMVYNYGKTKDNAKLFESISLPGITNRAQVDFFAKWHLAQLKLRPEVYTLNTDFEYLVCTRGDLVKVTHDVPRWGTSSGRISSIVSTSVLNLSESVYLEAGKTYTILIRTNIVDSTTKVLQSVTRNLTAITTSANYSQITLTSPILTTDNVDVDNLYMLGEVGHETQQLIVVSIEPMSNMSAKLTLVDYSPTIYTADATKDLLVYDPNVTGETIPLIKNTIQDSPTITGTSSESARSEQISTGIYQNVLLVSYTHPVDLSTNAEKIEIQVVPSDTEFIDSSLEGITTVNKETSGATITGLVTGGIYKIRARYTNAARTIIGPWSSTYYAKNIGNDTNTNIVASVSITLDGTSLIAAVPFASKPTDFKTYEYRFYKSTSTADFWDLDSITNGIIVIQSMAEARLSLLDIPSPRMSSAGITYKVACRILDNNNNYSTTSALGSYVLTTIQ